MRAAFEKGIITEAMFNNNQIRVTMTSNKCFDIRVLENGYYHGCIETTSKCDWNQVKKYVNNLIK